MEELLNKVGDLIEKSSNIPEYIKPVVKIICCSYIRESKGAIPMEGIINVCNTTFIKIDEKNEEFRGIDRHYAETQTDYDNKCNITHILRYINSSDYIKLISILTHELGHIITESRPNEITEDGLYPIIKISTGFIGYAEYDDRDHELMGYQYGFRMTDGFLENISSKIFASNEFRSELLKIGYDLKDYVYKDERIFPSRAYDEYKACFELFDYIMDGELTKFTYMTFNSNKELKEYIIKNRIKTIYQYVDASNNAFSNLKTYEGKKANDKFNELLNIYLEKKEIVFYLVDELIKIYGKSSDDDKLQELLKTYKSTLYKQKLLPISDEYKKNEKII